MKEQGYAELILRFLRTVILIDAILTGVVAGQAEVLDEEHGPPSLAGRSARFTAQR